MTLLTPPYLKPLAQRYLWWKTPEEVAAHPEQLIAQIMNIGAWDDVAALESEVGPERLCAVLIHAQPGQFSARSWQFWHLRLHLADIEHIPALPKRTFR